MTKAFHSLLRRLRRALWAFVAMAALCTAVAGPATDVETPFQPRAAVAMGTELECPQADLTQPGALCPDWSDTVAPPSTGTRGTLATPVDAPPPAPPLRPPRA